MAKLNDFEVTHAATFEFYCDVDDFRTRFSAATDSLLAVMQTIEREELTVKTCANAVFGVLCYFKELCEELNQMVDADDVTFPCVMVKEAK